jgi:hypothetical protein
MPKISKENFAEICFGNQFLTSGSGQTENTQIRVTKIL